MAKRDPTGLPERPRPTRGVASGKGPRCGAKTRSDQGHGRPCLLPAGFGTDHPGEGRCRYHGGLNILKHGRYSTITRPRIRELLDQYDKDPEPLNLLPEAKLLRALLTDFVERYDEITDGIICWHASWSEDYGRALSAWKQSVNEKLAADPNAEVDPVPHPRDSVHKPRQVLDITAAASLADKVGAMVDRIEKYTAAQNNVITLDTLARVLEQVGVELVQTLMREVSDETLRARILTTFEERWSSVHLDVKSGSTRHSQGHGAN
jgi:hypothetical protein